jgi:transposase InsO family protein
MVMNRDTIGSLQESSDGSSHILVVIIDCFSRFVELIPIVDTSAKAARSALLDIIGRYGVPNQIRSDNGTSPTKIIIGDSNNQNIV